MEKHSMFMFNIAKIAILKLIYRVKVLSIKTSAGFFAVIDKLFLKFVLKCKGLNIAKTIFE